MNDPKPCEIKTEASFLTHLDAFAGAKKRSQWDWIQNTIATREKVKFDFSVFEVGKEPTREFQKGFPGLIEFDINKKNPWKSKGKYEGYKYRIELDGEYGYFHIENTNTDEPKWLHIYKFKFINRKWWIVSIDKQLK